MAGIYIHIPFCQSRCTYCDFTSYPNRINQKDAYMASVFKEVKLRGYEFSSRLFNTVYIGGGTPSVIEAKYITGLLKRVKDSFNLEKTAEITIEINPGTADGQKIDEYLQAGINRFSIGMQSANDTLLSNLNRKHTAADFLSCCKLLQGQNISADILVGIEGQTNEDIQGAIDLAVLGGASHISMYALKAEEGTPLYSHYLNGQLPSDDEIAAFYDFGRQYLNSKGFSRYEVSNFCKGEKKSRHNLNYWKRGEYIGFGVSACSFFGGTRFTNTANFDDYINCILQSKFPVIASEEISGKEAQFEKIMLALRTDDGLNIREFNTEFNADFERTQKKALNKNAKYLERAGENIKIKDEYLFIQNNIIIDFLGYS